MDRDRSGGQVSLSEQSAERNCLKRGNLRFFLAGSGGMTAMRVMLETAVAAKETGADIVVGLVGFSSWASVGVSVPRQISGVSLL